MCNNTDSYESVEKYLESVKIEAISIPDIGISHVESNEAKNFNHPDYSSIVELSSECYVILDSGKWKEFFSLLRELIKSKYSRQYISNPSSLSKYIRENYSDWKTAIINLPPSLEVICEGGIDFYYVQEGLDVLGTELERGIVNSYIFQWMFYLLTVLDDLHALSENIASNLQRIKRNCLKGDLTPNKILIASIISKYFRQE